VLSAGTFLDSLRFRTHLAEAFGVDPKSVDADGLGEHGTSELLHWSGATIGGVPWADLATVGRVDQAQLRTRVENAVRFANINIIDVTGASQYGIGIVIARIIEAVLRDEKLVAPIGSYQAEYGVTLSLPSVIGANGVEGVLKPRLDAGEQQAFERSVAQLRNASATTAAQRAPTLAEPATVS
jgi:L-lactate dehydrogenase